jgi:hypothetical protein
MKRMYRKKETAKRVLTLLKAQDDAQKRIGNSDRERLAWAVQAAYEQPLTSEGILEFENDAYWFAVLSGTLALGGYLELPEQGGGKQQLRNFRDLIAKAIVRDKIPLGAESRSLAWHPGNRENPARYVLFIDSKDDFEAVVLGALRRLILDYGHLIRKCPAPAIRAKGNEQCGRWFVASRLNKEYCSKRCLSRKTTRENPPREAKRKLLRRREAIRKRRRTTLQRVR